MNILKFKEDYLAVSAKAEEIYDLESRKRHYNESYDGFHIEDDLFVISSSSWTSCSGEETYTIEIPLNEMNESIDFFDEKFKRENEERIESERLRQIKINATHDKYLENRDRSQYEKLKKRFDK